MRVVVVGATGTIGRPLVRALLSMMSSVWRGSPATVEEGVEGIAADATDTAAMRRALDAAESSTTSSTRSGAATSRRSTALPRPRSWQVPRRGATADCHLGGLGEGAAELGAPAQQG